MTFDFLFIVSALKDWFAAAKAFAATQEGTLLGLFVGFVSIIISVILWKKNPETKKVTYIIWDRKILLKTRVEVLSQDGTSVENTYRPNRISVLIIINSGNRPLLESDFIEGIRFFGDIRNRGGEFHNVAFICRSSLDVDTNVNRLSYREIIVQPNFLRQGEHIAISLNHTFLDCCLELKAATMYSIKPRRSLWLLPADVTNFVLRLSVFVAPLIVFLYVFVQKINDLINNMAFEAQFIPPYAPQKSYSIYDSVAEFGPIVIVSIFWAFIVFVSVVFLSLVQMNFVSRLYAWAIARWIYKIRLPKSH